MHIELTILMPCLNEAETLGICIQKALNFLAQNQINGEVLIADNGSVDGSQRIAEKNGARVIHIAKKGYGSALIGGSKAAYGKYVIMGDADDSYNFTDLMPFLEKLRDGYDLVMGNRFRGGIEKGAMPPLHRYLGNPILSTLGRLFFPSEIKDFHCGLRGYNTESIRKLKLQTTGMEYASEMVVQATLNNLKITEVPTTLVPDGRSRPPHLRSWHDGWRHLKFLLLYSPNWLFLYPGIILTLLSFVFMIILCVTPLKIGNITLDIHTLLYACATMIIGFNLIMFSVFSKVYAIENNYIPIKKGKNFIQKITSEKCLVCGSILFLIGIVASIIAFSLWGVSNFGELNPDQMMRITIPSLGTIIIGVEIMFAGFLVGILRIKTESRNNDE